MCMMDECVTGMTLWQAYRHKKESRRASKLAEDETVQKVFAGTELEGLLL